MSFRIRNTSHHYYFIAKNYTCCNTCNSFSGSLNSSLNSSNDSSDDSSLNSVIPHSNIPKLFKLHNPSSKVTKEKPNSKYHKIPRNMLSEIHYVLKNTGPFTEETSDEEAEDLDINLREKQDSLDHEDTQSITGTQSDAIVSSTPNLVCIENTDTIINIRENIDKLNSQHKACSDFKNIMLQYTKSVETRMERLTKLIDLCSLNDKIQLTYPDINVEHSPR